MRFDSRALLYLIITTLLSGDSMKVCVLLAALLGLWSVNRVPTAEGKLLANSHEQSLFRRLRQENTAWTDNFNNQVTYSVPVATYLQSAH